MLLINPSVDAAPGKNSAMIGILTGCAPVPSTIQCTPSTRARTVPTPAEVMTPTNSVRKGKSII